MIATVGLIEFSSSAGYDVKTGQKSELMFPTISTHRFEGVDRRTPLKSPSKRSRQEHSKMA